MGHSSQCSKIKKLVFTYRTFSSVSHCTIYFQGHHSSNSSPCSHRDNLCLCLQGARWAQGLLVCGASYAFLTFWSKVCMPWLAGGSCIVTQNQHRNDMGTLAMGRRTCSLGRAVGGDKCGNAGLSSDINSSDALDTGKSKKCYCCFPQNYLGLLQSHEQKAGPQRYHSPQSSHMALSKASLQLPLGGCYS